MIIFTNKIMNNFHLTVFKSDYFLFHYTYSFSDHKVTTLKTMNQ